MSAHLLTWLGFSLVALVVPWVASWRRWRGAGVLQRLALVLLLLYPVLEWLPKWHILPAAGGCAAAAASGAEVASGWLWVWLAGVLVQGGALGVALLRLHAWRRESRLLDGAEDLALVGECARALGLRRRVLVRVCAAPRGPAALGVWQPQVLLPGDWSHWPEETKRAVLLHELGHHVSRDPLWRMLSLVAAAVYWFNPLVWWLVGCLRREAEFACDARVVRCGLRVDRYAHILCDLAGRMPGPALALAAPGSLEQRVRRLQGTRGIAAPVLLGMAALALGVCALSLAVLRPRPAVPQAAPAYTPEEIATRNQANPFPED